MTSASAEQRFRLAINAYYFYAYIAAGVQLVCLVLILVVTLVAEARTGQADFAVPSTVTDAPRRR